MIKIDDFKKMLNNPNNYFDQPAEVLKSHTLTDEQKLRILKSWEYDAKQLQVAEEENMDGPGNGLLKKILDAQRNIGIKRSSEHSSPTK